MKVEKVDHIHIAVKDLEEALEFYSEILGTKFSDVFIEKTFNLRGAISPLGIELIQSVEPEGVVAKSIEKKGEGLHAISLKVPNLEEAVAELQSRGMRLVGRVEVGGLREAQFHPRDAYGVMIELTEYEDEHGAVTSMSKGG